MAARQAFSHESLSESSTTTSGSWPTATTFTFTPDANSDYWIIFSCLFANGSGTAGHYGEVSVYHDQGSTSVGYWASRSQEVSSPQDYFSVFCVHKSTFGASPGAQDYILSINSSHAGDATKIKDIRFLAIKADAADQYAVSDASSNVTGTTYTTKTTLTFTPPTAGDYLVLASAVMTLDVNNPTKTRLNHTTASTTYGGQNLSSKEAWLYSCFAVGAKVGLTAASNTFQLEYGAAVTTNVAYIEQARILALRLDAFDNAYVAQDFNNVTTTSASDSDFLTLTQTPLPLSHAVIAVGAHRTASNTVSGYFNVCKGGSNYTEAVREGVTSSSYFYCGIAAKETLAASSTAWKWRARAETAGTTIHVDEMLIAVLQLDASPPHGTGAITSTATLSPAGKKQGAGAGSTSSTATLATAGGKQGLGDGAITAAAGFASAGDKQAFGTASFATTGSLSSTGSKQAFGTASLEASAALSSEGTAQTDIAKAGTGAIAAGGALSSTGAKQGIGTGAISTLASLAFIGGKQVAGTGAIDATAALSMAGGKQASGATAPPATATLSTAGAKQGIGTGAIVSAATLSANAAKWGLGTGAIAATVALSATGAPSAKVILATSELIARRILVNTLAAKRLMTTALAGKRTLISDLHGKAQR